MTTKIHPRQIRTDLNTHVRREYKQEVIDDYARLLEQDREPPPLLTFFDPKTDETLLSDGFYRFFAHMKIRPDDMIAVETKLGSPDAARWAALGRTTSKDSDIPTNRRISEFGEKTKQFGIVFCERKNSFWSGSFSPVQ